MMNWAPTQKSLRSLLVRAGVLLVVLGLRHVTPGRSSVPLEDCPPVLAFVVRRRPCPWSQQCPVMSRGPATVVARPWMSRHRCPSCVMPILQHRFLEPVVVSMGR
jgi:hypothetical protein